MSKKDQVQVEAGTAQVATEPTAEQQLAAIKQAEQEQRMADLLEKEAKLLKIQNRERRYTVRVKLMVKKAETAIKAGLIKDVTDAEIDAEIARMAKK